MIFQTLEGINTTAKHVTIPKFRNKKNDILAKILNTFFKSRGTLACLGLEHLYSLSLTIQHKM